MEKCLPALALYHARVVQARGAGSAQNGNILSTLIRQLPVSSIDAPENTPPFCTKPTKRRADFEKKFIFGVDSAFPLRYNALNQTSKPLEEREVEAIASGSESRRCCECGTEPVSNGLSEGPVNGYSALLDRDGTQTRYQAAPYVGTG